MDEQPCGLYVTVGVLGERQRRLGHSYFHHRDSLFICPFEGLSARTFYMSADKCHVEGFLTKNHAGSPFSKDNQRRWFDTSGFTVCYYRDVRTPAETPFCPVFATQLLTLYIRAR